MAAELFVLSDLHLSVPGALNGFHAGPALVAGNHDPELLHPQAGELLCRACGLSAGDSIPLPPRCHPDATLRALRALTAGGTALGRPRPGAAITAS